MIQQGNVSLSITAQVASVLSYSAQMRYQGIQHDNSKVFNLWISLKRFCSMVKVSCLLRLAATILKIDQIATSNTQICRVFLTQLSALSVYVCMWTLSCMVHGTVRRQNTGIRFGYPVASCCLSVVE